MKVIQGHSRPSKASIAASLAIFFSLSNPSLSFQSPPCRPSFVSSVRRRWYYPLRSSVGGGDGTPPPGDNGDKGEWDDFLDPSKQESESLRRAREFIAENSLPLSYDAQETEEEDNDEEEGKDNKGDTEDVSVEDNLENRSAALVGPSTPGGDLISGKDLSKEALERNPYMAVVSRLSPSELISKFTATAHPRVQNAVRTTILGLIGGLPKMAFETTTYTTGQRLASLMFQLQMTGYMFKNAEYRQSLQGAIDPAAAGNQFLLSGSDDDEEDEEKEKFLKGKVRGKLRIKVPSFGAAKSDNSTGKEVEVDAAAYMSELRAEVSKLQGELMVTRKEKEEALRKDLLLYIRTLPEKELRSLTNTMSQDVLVAMKGLVNAVMSGIGEGQIGPDTITEQSGEALAQLCMWQLAVGYNLRTLEVREEMKKTLTAGPNPANDDSAVDTGVDLSDSDAFE